MTHKDTKALLEYLYNTFDFQKALENDPIEFPHRYSTEEDVEVVAFIACSLAYGQVSLFKPVIEKVLKAMGDRPAEFLLNLDPQSHWQRFAGIQYRFQKDGDILSLLYALSAALRKFTSLQRLFLEFYTEGDLKSAIQGAIQWLLSVDLQPVRRLSIEGRITLTDRGFKQLLPLPSTGSACKRTNLFLRWMVRDRDIDFGIWKGISRSSLIIPLDTHIARISRCLTLTRRNTPDWKMAEEITTCLKRFDPDDPLKYDFALCHQGIVGLCRECTSDRECLILTKIALPPSPQ